jgi:hypothetical protein
MKLPRGHHADDAATDDESAIRHDTCTTELRLRAVYHLNVN